MAEGGGGRSFLKWGCFGCLGCLGVIALFVGVALGVGWLSAKNTKLEDQVVSRELPAPEAPAEATEPPDSPDTPSPPAESSVGTAGRVLLDLRQGEFHIEPGEPGARVRVEARYDKKSHVLEETFEQPTDGPWVYRVTFRGTAGGWLRGIFAPSPKVTVYLPPDVPLELELDMHQGGAQVELGGLWLTAGRITSAQAGVQLSVRRPLHAPMDSLELSTSMAGMQIASLGNASPARLSVECSMAGLELDLRGDWVQDSSIELDAAMAGMEVRLPRDVTIHGVAGYESDLGSEEPEVRRPALTFKVSASDQKNVRFR